MKIVISDRKHGYKKIRIDSVYDLWALSKVIGKGDFVEGTSTRAFKVNNKEERKQIYVKIEAESADFSEFKKTLRINGKIIDGSPEEYIQKGRHHSIEFGEKDEIKITKDWLEFEENTLKDAEKESRKPKAYIILAEESKILIANISSYGIELNEVSVYTSKNAKKEADEQDYIEIFSRLDKNLMAIVAGPGFAKFKVEKFLRKQGFKVFVEEASYAEISGIVELVESGAVKKILEEHSLDKEASEMAELEKHIFKDDNLSAYGFDHVKKAVEFGAIEKILVTDSVLKSVEIRELLKNAEAKKAKVIVFSGDSPWGRKLHGYGNIAGILRFGI